MQTYSCAVYIQTDAKIYKTSIYPSPPKTHILLSVLNYNHVHFLYKVHYQTLQEDSLLTVNALTYKGGTTHPRFQTQMLPSAILKQQYPENKSRFVCFLEEAPHPIPPSWQLTVPQFAHHWLIKSPFSRLAPNRHVPCLWMLTTPSVSEAFSVDTIVLSTEQRPTVNTNTDFICKTQTTKT